MSFFILAKALNDISLYRIQPFRSETSTTRHPDQSALVRLCLRAGSHKGALSTQGDSKARGDFKTTTESDQCGTAVTQHTTVATVAPQ